MRGDRQLQNPAAVLMALELAAESLPVTDQAIQQGVATASLPGRLQILAGVVERIFDVAHNPQAAGVLADFLRQRNCPGRTRALMAMMRDKDMAGVAEKLVPIVDDWCVAGLAGPRGADAPQLAHALARSGVRSSPHLAPDVPSAYSQLRNLSRSGDRIVVFGSFQTVAEALCLES